MIKELEDAGVKNVKYVSNFKPINYYPNIENALMQRRSSKVVRFVFLSRIMREKGCDYILEAVRLLIAFGIGFFVSLIFLVSLLFSINEAVGIFVAAFILIEVVALIISMLIAKKTNILEEGEPIHNILMIDYYKFFMSHNIYVLKG